MMKNVGSADKAIRVSLGIIIAILVLAGVIAGTAAVVLGIVAAVMLITGLTGVCPAYSIFKIRTNKKVS